MLVLARWYERSTARRRRRSRARRAGPPGKVTEHDRPRERRNGPVQTLAEKGRSREALSPHGRLRHRLTRLLWSRHEPRAARERVRSRERAPRAESCTRGPQDAPAPPVAW